MKINWVKILPLIISTLAWLMFAWAVKQLRHRFKKWQSTEQTCPKCGASNSRYTGISGHEIIEKGKSPVNFYTLKCSNCQTRFKYFGEM